MTKPFQIHKVRLVYFSGTGSTALVAEVFEQGFTKSAVPVVRSEIRAGDFPSIDGEDILLLLFPVHAFYAP